MISEGIEEPVEASNASWLLTFHSFALLVSLWKFSHFRSRLPFLGFHPRVMFFSFFQSFSLFWFFYHSFKNSKFVLNGWIIYQDNFDWKQKHQPYWLWKIPQEKPLQSKYPHSIKMDFTARNVGLGSGFRKKG